MKTFDVQIQYRSPDGELCDPWIIVSAKSQAEAKRIAKAEAVQRSNGKGGYVNQIRLATP